MPPRKIRTGPEERIPAGDHLLRSPSSGSSTSKNHSSPTTDRLGCFRPHQERETMYSQRQEDLDLFSSHLEAKKAGPLVCPICSQTNTIVPKGAPIGEPSGEPVIESEPQYAYAACTNCGYSIFFDTDHLPRRQSS